MNRPSVEQIIQSAPWVPLEIHLNNLRERVDSSIILTRNLRNQYREELLSRNPQLSDSILRPSLESMEQAKQLLSTGTVAAADGTISPVPLLGGTKIQVGVVIVFNSGEIVDLVTRVFEAELASDADNAIEYFSNLRGTRAISNLLARAIMLFGERRLLLDQDADWRMIHGELIPHELRTGAGRPEQNLPPNFSLINEYITTEKFIAVSEGSNDIDILNAAILMEPGEYMVIRTLTDTLTTFLEGDPETGQSRANFSQRDASRFRDFIKTAGPKVAVVLVKASLKPYIIECHVNHVEDAVALFLADSLWTRGLPSDGKALTIRGFPFHIDLADQVAGTLFKGSDFRDFVESRLFDLGVEAGTFDIDPRRTR